MIYSNMLWEAYELDLEIIRISGLVCGLRIKAADSISF